MQHNTTCPCRNKNRPEIPNNGMIGSTKCRQRHTNSGRNETPKLLGGKVAHYSTHRYATH
eukprot:13696123-Ditylum_brightwellii.AAC.1